MKENWTYKKFGEVFNLQMGKTPSRDNLSYWGGDNIWVSIADLKDKYIDSTKEHITDLAVSESGIHKVPQGTAIMSFKLTIGRAAITKCDLFTNEAIMSFEPKETDTVLADYVFYYLKGCKWMGANKAVMGQTLNKKTITDNVFAYPTLETQSRIVSELDLLQSIIDKQKTQLKELDNLAQAVFYDMFGDPVENEKGWEVKKLGEFCRIGTGSTPNRERKEYYGGHIPWVKTTEVCNCLINNTEEYLTQLGLDNSNCSLYPPDTILMAMYGQGKTRGQIAILGITATTNQACAAIQYDSNVVDKTFLFQQLLLLYDNIRSLARGGNQANLNLNLVRGIQVIVPLLSQQQSFAAKIESIEKQKAAIGKSIEETQKLFDYTMDKYFG